MADRRTNADHAWLTIVPTYADDAGDEDALTMRGWPSYGRTLTMQGMKTRWPCVADHRTDVRWSCRGWGRADRTWLTIVTTYADYAGDKGGLTVRGWPSYVRWHNDHAGYDGLAIHGWLPYRRTLTMHGWERADHHTDTDRAWFIITRWPCLVITPCWVDLKQWLLIVNTPR